MAVCVRPFPDSNSFGLKADHTKICPFVPGSGAAATGTTGKRIVEDQVPTFCASTGDTEARSTAMREKAISAVE